jgi:hypothetical protein
MKETLGYYPVLVLMLMNSKIWKKEYYPMEGVRMATVIQQWMKLVMDKNLLL